MKSYSSGGAVVIRSLKIGPNPPAPVAEAHEAFTALGHRLTETEAKLAETRASSTVEVATAKREAAEARIAGVKPSRDPAKVEADFKKKVDDLEADLVVLSEQVDDAGNVLADLIIEHSDDWLAALDAAEAAAAETLQHALALAREALHDLGAARSAPAWLTAFVADYGTTRGRYWGFQSRPVTINVGRRVLAFDAVTPAEPFLDLAALALKPVDKPKPRQLTEARESSRARRAEVRSAPPRGAILPARGLSGR